MEAVTKRTNSEIMSDVYCLVDFLGFDEFNKYYEIMKEDKGFYNIKDFYEAVIKYVVHSTNGKLPKHLNNSYVI